MSGSDDADRGFLARWSQRKQEARQPEGKPQAKPGEDAASSGSAPPQNEHSEPEFDLSTLPKLEELTASTDITAFLRKGVPEPLRNAVLRKSWALDPAIRNYVGPALDYAYDWNAPDGVPGGGELGEGVDVARLVSQIMGEPAAETINSDSNFKDGVTSLAEEAPLESDLPADQRDDAAEQPPGETDHSTSVETRVISKPAGEAEESASIAESQAERPAAPQQLVRRHGAAKPFF
jgi:hypothetical protein